MKKRKQALLLVAAVAVFTGFGCSQTSPKEDKSDDAAWQSLISSSTLQEIKDGEQVVIVDVRPPEAYLEGHIPGSINLPISMPSSGWITSADILMELPPVEDMQTMLSEAGVSKDSRIVIISESPAPQEPPYVLANATRVLATLHYLGIKDVAILNGGINKWVENGSSLENDPTILPQTSFVADPNHQLFVSTDYVKESIGTKTIVDTRDAKVYFGEVMEEWAPKAGHIPTAVSMPVADVWNEDGSYKTTEELKQLLVAAVGKDFSKEDEIIIYCGVGGYTSTAYFVLHDLLGFENVKLYDGSAQAWVMENDMEM